MLLKTGCLLMNSQYGMPQLLHCSFGWELRPSDAQLHHQESICHFLLQWLCPAPMTGRRRSIMWPLCHHIKWCLQISTYIRRYRIWKWEQKYESSHSIMSRTMTTSCFHTRKFAFWTCHPKSTPSPSYPHAVHCWLTYEEDNTMENHSPEDDILAYHLPCMAEEEDDDMEEHFPTIPLDNDFWMEDSILEKHLCIHEDAQHALCPYPCPYLKTVLVQHIKCHAFTDVVKTLKCCSICTLFWWH